MNLTAGEPQTVETSQGKIAYIDTGSGPVVLFIDGLNSGDTWRDRKDAVPLDHRHIFAEIVEPRLTRDAPDAQIVLDARVQVLAEFLDLIGLARVNLFAETTGALTAMAFWAAHRHRVNDLHVISKGGQKAAPSAAGI